MEAELLEHFYKVKKRKYSESEVVVVVRMVFSLVCCFPGRLKQKRGNHLLSVIPINGHKTFGSIKERAENNTIGCSLCFVKKKKKGGFRDLSALKMQQILC